MDRRSFLVAMIGAPITTFGDQPRYGTVTSVDHVMETAAVDLGYGKVARMTMKEMADGYASHPRVGDMVRVRKPRPSASDTHLRTGQLVLSADEIRRHDIRTGV